MSSERRWRCGSWILPLAVTRVRRLGNRVGVHVDATAGVLDRVRVAQDVARVDLDAPGGLIGGGQACDDRRGILVDGPRDAEDARTRTGRLVDRPRRVVDRSGDGA